MNRMWGRKTSLMVAVVIVMTAIFAVVPGMKAAAMDRFISEEKDAEDYTPAVDAVSGGYWEVLQSGEEVYYSQDGIPYSGTWVLDNGLYYYVDHTGCLMKGNYSEEGFWVLENGEWDQTTPRLREIVAPLEGRVYGTDPCWTFQFVNNGNGDWTVNATKTYSFGSKETYTMAPIGRSIYTLTNAEGRVIGQMSVTPDRSTLRISEGGYTSTYRIQGELPEESTEESETAVEIPPASDIPPTNETSAPSNPPTNETTPTQMPPAGNTPDAGSNVQPDTSYVESEIGQVQEETSTEDTSSDSTGKWVYSACEVTEGAHNITDAYEDIYTASELIHTQTNKYIGPEYEGEPQHQTTVFQSTCTQLPDEIRPGDTVTVKLEASLVSTTNTDWNFNIQSAINIHLDSPEKEGLPPEGNGEYLTCNTEGDIRNYQVLANVFGDATNAYSSADFSYQIPESSEGQSLTFRFWDWNGGSTTLWYYKWVPAAE